jgi:hypothetical protein
MRRLAWALLAVLLYLPAAARAQESPAQILERLLSPPAYEGERAVMIWSAGEMGAVELLESCSGPGADRRLRLERRASPGLAPVVLVDGPREIVAWHAQERQAHSWLRSDLSRARLRRALSSYSWSIAGQDDLSGYRCLVVEARPTYAGGLVSRFWIERSHQVVLRREKYTPEGQLVYLSAFTDIDFLEQDPEEFQSPPARAAGSLSAAGRPRTPFAARVPRPPGGFAEDGAALVLDGSSPAGLHVVYSDGLETISLFQYAGRAPIDLPGASRQKVAGYPVLVRHSPPGTMLSWSDGERSYVLITSLPKEAAAPFLRELPPREPPGPGLLASLSLGWKRLLAALGF